MVLKYVGYIFEMHFISTQKYRSAEAKNEVAGSLMREDNYFIEIVLRANKRPTWAKFT